MTPHNTLLFLWEYVLLRPNKRTKKRRADRTSPRAGVDENEDEDEQDEGDEQDEEDSEGEALDPSRLEADDLRILDEVVTKTEDYSPPTSCTISAVTRTKEERVRGSNSACRS